MTCCVQGAVGQSVDSAAVVDPVAGVDAAADLGAGNFAGNVVVAEVDFVAVADPAAGVEGSVRLQGALTPLVLGLRASGMHRPS